MQSTVPIEGSFVWIRQRRWRVERARREHNVLRLDVSGRGGRLTFLAPIDRPLTTSRRRRPLWMTTRRWRARLAGLVARSGSSRALLSAVDARMDIRAYQLEPALALLGGARRVLIADAVGLGKTIQAGLFIAELHRRHPSCRTLVVVPSALLRQWSDELQAHFGLDVIPANGDALTRLATSARRDTVPWNRPGVWLGSLDYLKQPHVFGGAAHRAWDLLVLDEAHTVCGHSERHAAAAALGRRSRRVLLLTATPHNGNDEQFDRLLRLGALPCRDDEDEIVAFARTRDVADARAERRVRWHSVPTSAAEIRLLDGLAAFERDVLRRAGDERRGAALLVLSVFRKRALSTAGALLVSIERRAALLSRRAGTDEHEPRQGAFDFEGDEDRVSADEQAALGADIGLHADLERSWLERLRHLARQAAHDESKVARVLALLERARAPVVVFTEFRDSLHVLRSRIEPVRSVAALHGGLTPSEQHDQLHGFLSGSADVLLATDVAGQGLNLQARSRWVLNLELPWNPVRLEQRAGRVDRIGQTGRVHIGLLVARHPAETGLLARLARRTLAAKRRVGATTLSLTVPDERAVRAHLLGGEAFAEAEQAQPALAISHTWSRPAAASARQLRRRRALARRWRAHLTTGRIGATTGWPGPLGSGSPGSGALLLFSVPLIDNTGRVIERHLVPLSVARQLPEALKDARLLECTARHAGRMLRPRQRRLMRLLAAGAIRAVERERAIAVVLEGAGHAETQPGLFDQRAVRAAVTAFEHRGGIRRELQERLSGLLAESCVTIGSPTLVMAAGGRKS